MKIETKKLEELLSMVLKIENFGNYLPEVVYMELKDGKLIIKAHSFFQSIKITVNNVKGDGFVTVVDMHKLYDVIKNIKDKYIEITYDDYSLKIKTELGEIKIDGKSVDEFTRFDLSGYWVCDINAKDLFKAIKSVSSIIQDKNFTDSLCGIDIKTKKIEGKKYLVFTGVDQERLAEFKIQNNPKKDFIAVIKNSDIIETIEKIIGYNIKNNGKDIKISVSKHNMFLDFNLDDIQINYTTNVIQKRYFSFDKMINPKTIYFKAIIDKTLLDNAIRNLLASNKDFIFMEAKNDKILLSTNDGKTTINLPCTTNGEIKKYKINGKHILEFLNFTNGKIEMKIGEKDDIILGTILLRLEGDNNYVCVTVAQAV